METLEDAVNQLCKNIDGLKVQVDGLIAQVTRLNDENLKLRLERDNLRKFLNMVTTQGEPQ